MKTQWRNVRIGLLVFLFITAAFGHRALIAQAAPAAAHVHVVRDLNLGGSVWPADLNRDGITDLVSSGAAVQVSIGNGDGTFQAPVQSSFAGFVLGVADFNGDGRPDVVAQSCGTNGRTVILPGTGKATLGSPIVVATGSDCESMFALSGDFNADGKRDLVLPGGNGVLIYPGNGDFTFDTPVNLTTGFGPADGIVADLNGDGRLDLVTANEDGNSLSVFLNQGGLVFAPADIPLGHPATDVAAADLNHDGHLDLVASAGRPDSLSGFGDGEVFVLFGIGNGTFGAPTEYPVPHGPTQIVVGDFNRDGILDIATGNRSAIARDDCSLTFKTWDSVSILAGFGNGTFASASNFSLGDQSLTDERNAQADRYRSTLTSLNTSDLNRDGAADLIASNGAILFNIPAVANRAPTVDAGPDTVLLNDDQVVLQPKASDPDDDMLTWEIRDQTGRIVATYPDACTQLSQGSTTFTVTVDDGHGHTATDSVVYTVKNTGTPIGSFAEGDDIGHPAPTGGQSFNSGTGTYSVTGSGADIWGTSDAFHYVWTEIGGDFDIVTRVDSIQNVDPWTKAGVMIRENLDAGARHASLFASSAKGVAFQRRATENGISVNTAGPETPAPVWLRLSRRGDVIAAYYRKAATDLWTAIGTETLAGLVDSPLVGLAVTSHHAGTAATATFTNVIVENQLPWIGTAIGAGSGSLSSWDGTVMTVQGKGADIWNTADAFFFVHSGWSGDVTITARVRSIQDTNAWSKAGVMFRESLDANSKQVMVIVSPGKGVAMQYRATTGGASASVGTGMAGAAPEWVRLERSGNTFTASVSKDNVTWTTVGSVTIPMNFTLFLGMPVTSHDTAATTTAAFEDIRIGS